MAKKPVRRSTAKKPAPRKPAQTSTQNVNWAKLEASPQFAALKKAKLAFIVPAVIFFIVYYFTLPLLVGYAPGLMSRKVFGAMNLAYLFALSQFFMAWILAGLYVRAAGRFDKQAAQVAALAGKGAQR